MVLVNKERNSKEKNEYRMRVIGLGKETISEIGTKILPWWSKEAKKQETLEYLSKLYFS